MFKSGGAGPLTVRGATSRLTGAGMRAVTLVAAEGTARIIRTRVFKNLLEGSAAASFADFGIGTALGIGAEMALGRQVGSDVAAGVYASILRRMVKQASGGKPGIIQDALGDAGGGTKFVMRDGRLVPLGSYVGTGAQKQLGSWVGAGAPSALGDETTDELGW
jgi:hypothetical protein